MARPARGMHPEDVKAAIRIKFRTVTALTDSWGLHRSIVTQVLRNPLFSIRTERRIADALKLTPHAIWPDRWRRDGSPIPLPDRAKCSAAPDAPHRQKAIAA